MGKPSTSCAKTPQRKGLLFAGTERGVYVSFDDGENWQSLRLNMPATSVRDLIIKDDDLAIATHGRGFGFSITSRRCASSRRRRQEPVAFQTANCAPRPLEYEHRHAAAAG